MLGKLKIFIVLGVLAPCFAWADGSVLAEFNSLYDIMKELDYEHSEVEDEQIMWENATNLKKELDANLEELEKNYEDLKANEQSLANRTLTAASIAATGIGTMELLQGRAEQKADKEADQAMDALIATMRCTYGGGKQVNAGPDKIELPGGNDAELMKYRTEYFALAKDLKERKEALGMKPGIEAEEIKDKASMGLYDDENIGIESGAYASLYRAKMLESETDQKKIDEEKETSSKRVKGGAIAAGVGVIGGIVGNAIINRNAPKNRAEQLLAERDQIIDEVKGFMQKKIERCNEGLTAAQNVAEALSSDPNLAQQYPFLQDIADMASSTQQVTSEADLIKLKGSPLCK